MLRIQKLKYLRADKIDAGDELVRSVTDGERLDELCESVRSNGIVQPLLVRRAGRRYELLCGSRRLQAARLAGVEMIPCAIVAGSGASASWQLAENSCREPLHYLETAAALQRLCCTGLSGADAAGQLGIAPAAAAKKMKLLAMSENQRRACVDSGLSERQAQAVMRLPEDEWEKAIVTVARRRLSDAKTEQYVRKLLRESDDAPCRQIVIKDVRIILNTINKVVDVMNQAGLEATAERRDSEDNIEYIVRIPIEKLQAN